MLIRQLLLTLSNGLSSNAALRSEVSWVKFSVLIRHPGHFTLASVHIWSGDVDSRAQKAVSVEFFGKLTSNALHFRGTVLLNFD